MKYENLRKYNVTGQYLPIGALPTTVAWYPADTKSNFLSTPNEHQDSWNQKSKIAYKINEYGFRSDTFPEEEMRDSITFLGCSLTFGIGIQEELSWPALVSEHFNLKKINLGIPAGSLDSAFRVYNEWQPVHKSKITCVLRPPGQRMELYSKNNWVNVGHWSLNTLSWIPVTLAIGLLDSTFTTANYARNTAAIKYIAQETESSVVMLTPDNALFLNYKDEMGRDGQHPGMVWHRQVADEFIKQIITQRGE